MLRTGLFLALVALIGGCATAPKVAYTNPSITVDGMTADAARAYVSQRCIMGGARVETNTPTQVVCAKAFDGSFGSLMYRALTTPDYSTNPDAKVRYNFFQNGAQLMVAADMYVEFENAYGQKNIRPIQNFQLRDQAQAMLQNMKDEHMAANAVAAATPPSAPVAAAAAPAPAPAAFNNTDAGRKFASSIGCPVGFNKLSDDGRRAIFETTCANTRDRILVECVAGACAKLR